MATVARAAAATTLVFAVLVVAVSGRTDVVVILAPPEGQPEAVLLEGGPPAWASSSDGEVMLLSALIPTGGPVGGLVGWCGDGGRFVDPHHGLSFAPDGRRYVGSVPGRLPGTAAVGGLSRYEIEAFDGGGQRDPVRVRGQSAGVGQPIRPDLAGDVPLGAPQTCRLTDRRLGGGDPATLEGVTDHAHLARPLDLSRDGWQIAEGWLWLGPADDARWCGGPVDREVPCGQAVPIDMAPDGPAHAGPVVTAVGDPLAVLVQGRRIASVAVLPSSTWIGSSLRGTRTHRFQQLARDPTGSRVIVAGGGAEPCAGPAPTMSSAPADARVVYIDNDTVVDLPGARSPKALPPLGQGAAIDVDVTVDAVTCRALLVTSPP